MKSKKQLVRMTGAIEIPVLENRRGIYFLTKGWEVVYVGKTEDVTQRLGYHITRKAFDGISFLPYTGTDLSAYEKAWIRILQPALNVQSKEAPTQGDMDHMKRGLSFRFGTSVQREIERRYASLQSQPMLRLSCDSLQDSTVNSGN